MEPKAVPSPIQMAQFCEAILMTNPQSALALHPDKDPVENARDLAAYYARTLRFFTQAQQALQQQQDVSQAIRDIYQTTHDRILSLAEAALDQYHAVTGHPAP